MSMSDQRELRVGIIGLGIGRFHASCFAALPGVRIVAVADRGGRRLPGPLGEFAAHYGAQPYELGEKMLAEESLDVVSICSPPASHRSLVELAAARGVHVLLEKPMAWSLGDCDAMIDACAKAGVGLQVNFPMRRLGAVQKLQQLLSAGDLGAPAMASADYVMGPRPNGPRSSRRDLHRISRRIVQLRHGPDPQSCRSRRPGAGNIRSRHASNREAASWQQY